MLRLFLFGRFRAADGLGNEIQIKSKKARALLAYLALPPGKERSREAIMALLWSDRGEEQARASLRQALTGLRKDLDHGALDALQIAEDWLKLDPSLVVVEPPARGDRFLDGLQVNDPAFEDWLRDERLRLEDVVAADTEAPIRPLPDKPSIAVLPFVNTSGDADQDYFAEGLSGDIVAQLSRFRSLFVISSSSSFLYKDQAPVVQDVGRELGVAYVVDGNVRKSGNRVRISVELVDAATGQQIWADRYDRHLEDIFAVQDEVTKRVVSTLAGQIEDIDRRRAMAKRSEELAAYDYLLLGEQALKEGTKEGLFRARALFQKAIDLDPGSARAYASLARSYIEELDSDWKAPRELADEAFNLAKKAVDLDQLDSRARTYLAVAYQLAKSNFEAAQGQFSKAIELNPNDADTYCYRGWCHALAGQVEQAIESTEQAIRLSPFDVYDCCWGQAIAYYLAGRYEEALTSLGRIADPGFAIEAYRAACYAQLGRNAEARKAMERFMVEAKSAIDDWPNEDSEVWRRYWAHGFTFQDPKNFEHLLEGFRNAGLPV
jgi:TolB-like protein